MRTGFSTIVISTGSMLALLALHASCAAPHEGSPMMPSRFDDVRISPIDMRTGIDARAAFEGRLDVRVAVEVFDHWGDFESEELARWDGALRLVRWPSRELVPGEWRVSSNDPESPRGGLYTLSFVPASRSYEEGWYAVQIDFAVVGDRRGPALRGELPIIDGWTTNRFRIGSQPIVRMYGSLSDTRAEGPSISLRASEVIELREERVFSNYLEVSVNTEVRRCTVTGGDQSRPNLVFGGFDVDCGTVPVDALMEIRVREGFFDGPVWDYRGGSPPSWTFRAGEVPDNAGPSEAVFVAPASEVRP